MKPTPARVGERRGRGGRGIRGGLGGGEIRGEGGKRGVPGRRDDRGGRGTLFYSSADDSSAHGFSADDLSDQDFSDVACHGGGSDVRGDQVWDGIRGERGGSGGRGGRSGRGTVSYACANDSNGDRLSVDDSSDQELSGGTYHGGGSVSRGGDGMRGGRGGRGGRWGRSNRGSSSCSLLNGSCADDSIDQELSGDLCWRGGISMRSASAATVANAEPDTQSPVPRGFECTWTVWLRTHLRRKNG